MEKVHSQFPTNTEKLLLYLSIIIDRLKDTTEEFNKYSLEHEAGAELISHLNLLVDQLLLSFACDIYGGVQKDYLYSLSPDDIYTIPQPGYSNN